MAYAPSAVSAANTSSIFTVDNLAERWITQTATGVQKKREIFNFKATWFNIATVATIVSIALTIFTGSIAIAALAWLSWNVRTAVYNAIVSTGDIGGGPRVSTLFERLNNVVEEGSRLQIREYLEIGDPNWNFLNSQILDFPVWMNLTPAPLQQGARNASNSAAPAMQNASNASATVVRRNEGASQEAEEHEEDVDAFQEHLPVDALGDVSEDELDRVYSEAD